jgi:hypothetical protein
LHIQGRYVHPRLFVRERFIAEIQDLSVLDFVEEMDIVVA